MCVCAYRPTCVFDVHMLSSGSSPPPSPVREEKVDSGVSTSFSAGNVFIRTSMAGASMDGCHI